MGKKIALVVCVILLIGAFIGAVIYLNNQEKVEAERELAIEQAIRPFRMEETQILSEIDTLNLTYERLMYGSGTLTLLFNEPDTQVYSLIYPMLSAKGYSGTIAISGTQYPGKDGYMSMAQFKELLRAGWSYCLKWTGDIRALEQVQNRLSAQGIQPTQTVYFQSGTYFDKADTELAKYGYTVVIHHGETNLDIAVYDSDSDADIWHPGAVLWYTGKRTLQNVVLGYGGIIFEISFEDDGYTYVQNSFESMLTVIDDYGDTCLVLSPEQARQYRMDKEQAKESVQAQWEAERDILEGQLRQIWEQIDKIEEQYANS